MTPTDPRAQAAPLLDDAQTDRLAEVLRSPFEVLPQIPSTNDELVERAQRAARRGQPLPDLSLLAAEHQSAGRGRLDRKWVTGPGDALTFSLLLRPAHGSGPTAAPLPTQSFPWLTVLLAAAIAQTLRAQGIEASLKWPNDVLVETGSGFRKICGVLASLVVHDGSAPALVRAPGSTWPSPRRALPACAARDRRPRAATCSWRSPSASPPSTASSPNPPNR